MAQGQRPGQGNPASNKRQPTLDAIRLTPGFKALDLQQLADLAAAVAHGSEIHQLIKRGFRNGQGQGHPEAAIGGVLHRIAMVVGEQNFGGHGDQESLHWFWLRAPQRHRPQLWHHPSHTDGIAFHNCGFSVAARSRFNSTPSRQR